MGAGGYKQNKATVPTLVLDKWNSSQKVLNKTSRSTL